MGGRDYVNKTKLKPGATITRNEHKLSSIKLASMQKIDSSDYYINTKYISIFEFPN
jgi:hypothetical protein